MTGTAALFIAIGEVAGVTFGVLIGWLGHAHYRRQKARRYGLDVAAGRHEYRRWKP